VSWFHDCAGGEFAFYPDGASAPPVAHQVHYNTAILLDTDSVFHGVDRVKETATSIEALRPGMKLVAEGGRRWRLLEGEQTIAQYDWRDLRFSVSWKAYCFADADDKRRWSEHADDLTVDFVLDRMLADLRRRGKVQGDPPRDQALVELIIDEYIHYPGR
jgi:hypothetical protein